MTAFWHYSHLRRPVGRAPRGDRFERRDSLAPSVRRALKIAAYRDCNHRCVYCGSHMPFAEATLDHVQPIARGGRSQPGNLVVACGPCNRLKADQHPQEFFSRWPAAGENFMRYARTVHRALKRSARRAVSLAWAEAA
jgi:5-methylcytosine-specific restriction endonuclease McrA